MYRSQWLIFDTIKIAYFSNANPLDALRLFLILINSIQNNFEIEYIIFEKSQNSKIRNKKEAIELTSLRAVIFEKITMSLASFLGHLEFHFIWFTHLGYNRVVTVVEFHRFLPPNAHSQRIFWYLVRQLLSIK